MSDKGEKTNSDIQRALQTMSLKSLPQLTPSYSAQILTLPRVRPSVYSSLEGRLLVLWKMFCWMATCCPGWRLPSILVIISLASSTLPVTPLRPERISYRRGLYCLTKCTRYNSSLDITIQGWWSNFWAYTPLHFMDQTCGKLTLMTIRSWSNLGTLQSRWSGIFPIQHTPDFWNPCHLSLIWKLCWLEDTLDSFRIFGNQRKLCSAWSSLLALKIWDLWLVRTWDFSLRNIGSFLLQTLLLTQGWSRNPEFILFLMKKSGKPN